MKLLGLIILTMTLIFYIMLPYFLWKRLSALSKTREDIPEETKLIHGGAVVGILICISLNFFIQPGLLDLLRAFTVLIVGSSSGYIYNVYDQEKKRIQEILKLKEQSNSETEK